MLAEAEGRAARALLGSVIWCFGKKAAGQEVSVSKVNPGIGLSSTWTVAQFLNSSGPTLSMGSEPADFSIRRCSARGWRTSQDQKSLLVTFGKSCEALSADSVIHTNQYLWGVLEWIPHRYRGPTESEDAFMCTPHMSPRII